MTDRKPRIRMMNEDGVMEEIAYDEMPGTGAIDLNHQMAKLRLSVTAINQASKIIPIEVWKQRGLCTWLQAAAEHFFALVPADKSDYLHIKSGVRYMYEFDQNGPVLKGVRIG
ncbi:hypothetical protein [Bradyrhizobium sp. ORS 285]|uniref:hypothetical protein n=1 Tax=Bradyrhizobium sp. ORS 285 TaxID=115808 RepID=UPI000550B113|nr:hypothetical protein [Bradyrhizobium sp. ORS 285]